MTANGRYLVRSFDHARDREAVYRCYLSSFYHNSWPIIDQAEPKLLEEVIDLCVRTGDVTFVAEAEGEARGILVGYFPAKPSSLERAFRLTIMQLLKVISGRYAMTAFARAAWWRSSLGELSYLVRHPRSPAEVLLLASQSEYRGGIGRAMMDAWVQEVRASGYQRTTVCTDSTVSWDFYERYGFERVRDFELKSFFHSLPGEQVRGYIYSLDI